MKLNVKAMALAAGNVVAGFFLLCSLLYAIAPRTADLTSHLFHIDVTSIFRPITIVDVVLGTICWWVGMALLAGMAATLYNRSVGK
jgi:hypothetical protein